MLRGEREFLGGMILLLVGPWIAGAVGNLLHPAAVALCIIGILLILGAAFDTG